LAQGILAQGRSSTSGGTAAGLSLRPGEEMAAAWAAHARALRALGPPAPARGRPGGAAGGTLAGAAPVAAALLLWSKLGAADCDEAPAGGAAGGARARVSRAVGEEAEPTTAPPALVAWSRLGVADRNGSLGGAWARVSQAEGE